jgi:hypothetical protein
MPNLDEKLRALAGQILKRQLSDEEQLDIYRISDAAGMRDVQSFLYLLLVFKLHEDTMARQFSRFLGIEKRISEKFDELKRLEEKISATIKVSVESILKDGGERIGREMASQIVKSAKDILNMNGKAHLGDGLSIMSCLLSITSMVAYQLGIYAERKGSSLAINSYLGWKYVGYTVLSCGLFKMITWGLANKESDILWIGMILLGAVLFLYWAFLL